MDIAVEEEEMLIVIAGMDLCDMQASAGRRRPRRPGFPHSLLPSWESDFVSRKFAHQGHGRKLRRPWRIWGRERGLQRSGTARTSTSWGALAKS